MDAASRSYWLGRGSSEPGPPLDGSRAVDVVVVGGGLTGLWTAILLKEADAAIDVAVVENRVVGSGASGRCAGLATPLVARSLAALVRRCGAEHAGTLWRAAAAALRRTVDFADAEGIRASLTRPGLLTLSTRPGQDEPLDKDLRAAERLGLEDVCPLDRSSCLELVRGAAARRGYLTRAAVLVDPAALARGLAQAARRRGVLVYERTPVDHLATVAGLRIEARTPFGTLHADRAVLATNAWASAAPDLRRHVFTAYVSAFVTRPLGDDEWDRVGWAAGVAVTDRRAVPHFARPTPDGRVLWGGGEVRLAANGPTPRREGDPVRTADLEAAFRATFPGLGDLGAEAAWTYPVGLTADGLPLVRWLRGERTVAALVPTRSVAAARLVAEAVRDATLGRRGEASAVLLDRRTLPLPPEPLRGVVLNAVQRNLVHGDERDGAAGVVARAARELLA